MIAECIAVQMHIFVHQSHNLQNLLYLFIVNICWIKVCFIPSLSVIGKNMAPVAYVKNKIRSSSSRCQNKDPMTLLLSGKARNIAP